MTDDFLKPPPFFFPFLSGVEFGGFFDRYAATCVFYDLNPREHTKLLNLIRQNVAIEPRELLLSRISNLHKIDIRPLTQARTRAC